MEGHHGIRHSHRLLQSNSIMVILYQILDRIMTSNRVLHILPLLKLDLVSGKMLVRHHHLHHQETTSSRISVKIPILPQQKLIHLLLKLLLVILWLHHSHLQHLHQEIILYQTSVKISMSKRLSNMLLQLKANLDHGLVQDKNHLLPL